MDKKGFSEEDAQLQVEKNKKNTMSVQRSVKKVKEEKASGVPRGNLQEVLSKAGIQRWEDEKGVAAKVLESADDELTEASWGFRG